MDRKKTHFAFSIANSEELLTSRKTRGENAPALNLMEAAFGLAILFRVFKFLFFFVNISLFLFIYEFSAFKIKYNKKLSK